MDVTDSRSGGPQWMGVVRQGLLNRAWRRKNSLPCTHAEEVPGCSRASAGPLGGFNPGP